MKILVAYMSQTGNTKKVAESIFSEISEDKEIKPLSEVAGLDDYDLTFIGFPMHAFGPAQDGKVFLDKQASGKKVALFVTHGVHEDNEDLRKWLKRCEKAAANTQLVGMFNCQGEVAPEIVDSLKASDDPQMISFCEESDKAKGQPDEMRLEKAKKFALEVIGVAGNKTQRS